MLHVNELVIPPEAYELEGFRRWKASMGEDGPRVHFVQGEVFLEMGSQKYRSHLSVASEVNAVLRLLAREPRIGRYYADGGWITNVAAGISNEPDGFLVRWATYEAGEAVFGDSDIELRGRADMVLEVVSPYSVPKDTRKLRTAYAAASIPEYWLVDARDQETLLFQILVLTDGVYAARPADADGWIASPVWGREFRLRQITDLDDRVDFRLDVRD